MEKFLGTNGASSGHACDFDSRPQIEGTPDEYTILWLKPTHSSLIHRRRNLEVFSSAHLK